MSVLPNRVDAFNDKRAQTTDRLSISGKVVVNVFEANTFVSRLRGLHRYLPLAEDEGLIIRPCNAVHTMTMPNVIDVVFVDKNGTVLKAESVPPRRFIRSGKASAVIEMAEGAIDRMGLVVGDVLNRQYGVWG